MNLSPYIKALLLEHDCVILPDFGGFVCQNTSAKLSPLTHRIEPPSKHISFNKSLQNNDALLANHVKNDADLDYNAAMQSIREAIVEWKTALHETGRLQIDGIGTLYVDKADKWRFVQNEDLNFNLNAFGLDSIKLTLVEGAQSKAETPAQVETPVIILDNSRPIENNPKVIPLEPAVKEKKRTKRGYYVLAAACFLPIAFYAYWLPAQTNAFNRGYVKTADFNPFRTFFSDNNAAEQQYNKRNTISVDAFDTFTIEPLGETIDLDGKVFNVGGSKLESNTASEAIIPVNSGNYHLIGGCFSKASNADGQIDLLKAAGFNSYILDMKGGLHRVCVGSYNSAAEAKLAKTKLSDLGKSGWVLKQ